MPRFGTHHAKSMPMRVETTPPTVDATPLHLGAIVVRPLTRELEGPGGVARLEPRVLLVLSALARVNGEVVARATLLRLCWPGMVVGEDALNRAISELRKALRTADGGVSVVTIARTGYSLRVAPPKMPAGQASPASAPPSSTTSRRRIIASAGLGLGAGLGGLAALLSRPGGDETRAARLIAQAIIAMREDRWGAIDPVVLLGEAVRLRPDDARAWGLLALARRDVARNGSDQTEFEAIADCQLAIKAALARDPEQPDAQVALATLTPPYTDWLVVEQRLKTLLQRFRDHEPTLVALAELHASTGRALDLRQMSLRLATLEPMSTSHAVRMVLALWRCGEHAEMNRRCDEAMRTWPNSDEVWQARMLTLGFTGNPAEALRMIDRKGSPGQYPPLIGEAIVAALRAYRGQTSTEAAIAASTAAGTRRQSSAAWAIPLLASLGAIDQAFAMADAYFLDMGPIKLPYRFAASAPTVREMRDRQTETLFVPLARTMWLDARFPTLCRRIGLLDYWRAAGVGPHLLGTRPFAIEKLRDSTPANG